MISNRTSKIFRGIGILIVIASHYAEWIFVEPQYPTAREWISTWGPIGVSIFFLFSGYGLVKSAQGGENNYRNNGGITLMFLFKRFLAAYLPYLLIVGAIHGYFKDFAEADLEFYKKFLTGYEYWYMQVMFIMYILFMLIWRFGRHDIVRVILITAGIIAVTARLYNMGRADFWQLSNIGFLIGIYAAVCEKYFFNIMNKVRFKLSVLLAGLIGFAICFKGMHNASLTDLTKVFGWEMALNIFWAIAVLGLAYFISLKKEIVFSALGENSLFIYLLHTILFWQLIFKFENSTYLMGVIFTALITICVSIIIGNIYNLTTKYLLMRMENK